MGYNERIFLSSSIEDLTGWIEGRLLLGRLGVAEPTYSRTIFPPLTVLERVLGRGGDLIDNGRIVGGMNHTGGEGTWKQVGTCQEH